MEEKDGEAGGRKPEIIIDRPRAGVRLLLYGVVPLLFLGGMVAMYYSGVPALRSIVSPETPSIPEDLRREYGLLESLQNLCLLALAGVALAGLRVKRRRTERIALWIVLVAAIFLLMEETDYGLHYIDLLRPGADRPSDTPGFFNVHRIGYTQRVLKNIAKFGGLTFFGAFAILFARSRHVFLRYVAPDRFAVLTILLVTALQEFVWKLSERVALPYGSLDGQEDEFAELGIYYVALLYLADMVFRRRIGHEEATADGPATADSPGREEENRADEDVPPPPA